MNVRALTKSSIELIPTGNRRWVRFPNADKEYLEEESSAIVYHSGNLFRVFTKHSCFDYLCPNNAIQDFLTFHKKLRQHKILQVQIFSEDQDFLFFLADRHLSDRSFSLKEATVVSSLKKPVVAGYKPTTSGLRQIEYLRLLTKAPTAKLERLAHGIEWKIFIPEAYVCS